MSLSLYRPDIIREFGGFYATHRISRSGIYYLFPKDSLVYSFSSSYSQMQEQSAPGDAYELGQLLFRAKPDREKPREFTEASRTCSPGDIQSVYVFFARTGTAS